MTESTVGRRPFVLSAAAAVWYGSGGHLYVAPEQQGERGLPDERWPQFGFSVDVLEPGAGNSYHREGWEDESFLILSGECDLVIEGELHRLDAGTFVHCPARTAHLFVGAGDGPCALVMFGARGRAPKGEPWGEYLPEPHAAEFGLAVERPTSDPDVAYAGRAPYKVVERPWSFALDRSVRRRATPVGSADHGAARLEPGAAGGLRRVTSGWYILHVDDAEWADNGRTARIYFDGAVKFEQYGVNLHVVRSGEPASLYHHEHPFDEAMLVLDGAGLVLLDDREHPVRVGDFVYCPGGTGHAFVAAPDRELVVLMVGTRDAAVAAATSGWLEYPVNDLAARYRASVAKTTNDMAEAYSGWPERVPTATPPWRWRGA